MPYSDSEKSKESKRRYYLKNKQAVIDRAKKWAAEHPEKRRDSWRKTNKKRALAIRHWQEKKFYDGNATITGKSCVLCGLTEKLNIHHRDGNNGRHGKPLNNSPENLVILCDHCHPKVHNRWNPVKDIAIKSV